MKELIQEVGVRKWFGDEWIILQFELMSVFEGMFAQYAQPFVLSGCVVSGSNVSPGIVFLPLGTGYKLCRFAGATGVTFPVYFDVETVEENRLYIDGDVKPVAVNYNAVLTATNTGSLLELKADNTTPRLADAIQDATHRFVSDAEKTSYAGQANLAITTLRGGVSSTLNTLEKLRANLQLQIDSIETGDVNADEILATIRGGVATAYDTLQKMLTYVNTMNVAWSRLTGVPEYTGSDTLAGTVVNFAGKPILRKTLSAPTALTVSNLIENKSITLVIVPGGHALTLPSSCVKLAGDYDAAVKNYIQLLCVNATAGSEEIVYTITQAQ